MRFMLSLCLFASLFGLIRHSKAVNIVLNGLSQNSTANFEIISGDSVQSELQIINDTTVTRLLSLGHVNLQLVPDGITNGQLLLSASPSSMPLFSGALGNITNGNGSLSLSASPALPPFEQSLNSGNRGTLVDLTLSSESDTVGTFNLVASPFNLRDLSLSSHWVESGVIGFQPLSNSNRNQNNLIVLASITVSAIPEPTSSILLGFSIFPLIYRRNRVMRNTIGY